MTGVHTDHPDEFVGILPEGAIQLHPIHLLGVIVPVEAAGTVLVVLAVAVAVVLAVPAVAQVRVVRVAATPKFSSSSRRMIVFRIRSSTSYFFHVLLNFVIC